MKDVNPNLKYVGDKLSAFFSVCAILIAGLWWLWILIAVLVWG